MGIKLDPIEAINQLKEKYPQYDFSKAVFTKSSEKITVICHKHGEFYPTYNNMKSKNRGCPKCNGGVKFTEQDAIDKLKQFFPDYDYSKFKYNGHDKECTLICKNGHEVTKKYNVFAIGYGCSKCKDTNLKTEEHKIRKEDYIEISDYIKELENVYPNIDWSNAYNLERKKDKVKVSCIQHGEIEVVLENIKSLKHPCPFCANVIKQCKEVTEDFLSGRDSSKTNSNDTHLCKRKDYIDKRNDKLSNSIDMFRYLNPEFTIPDNLNSGLTAKDDIIVECKEHGLFRYPSDNLRRFLGKIICPHCNGGYSIEFYILRRLRERYPSLTIEHKNRSVIDSINEGYKLEIDILIKDISLGIEYNEIGCHSENSNAYNGKHFSNISEYEEYKYNKSLENGIELIFIRETEINKYGMENFLYNLFYKIDSKLKMK